MTNLLGVWAANLQPASFRGEKFLVRNSKIIGARRTAVHQYPERDTIWVEDLGLGQQKFSFVGFLVGDDVYAQRDQFRDAALTAGPGDLIHPSFGLVNASLVECCLGETMEEGRVVQLDLTFLQTARSLYPVAVTVTPLQTAKAASGAFYAIGSNFATIGGPALALGNPVTLAVVATGALFTGLALSLVADAGRAIGAIRGIAALVGGGNANFGRYAGGGLTVAPVVAAIDQSLPLAQQTALATVALLAVADAGVAAVADAAVGFTASAAAPAPASLAASASGLTEALRNSVNDPLDAIRILTALAQFTPGAGAGVAPIGAAVATVTGATGDLCRRSALVSLALATSAWKPISYDNAVTIRRAVCGLLEAEATIAADALEIDTYQSLHGLAGAVANDLDTRAARLPRVRTLTLGANLPASVLAFRLYGDATRAADLIARNDPPCPLFMPTVIEALSA